MAKRKTIGENPLDTLVLLIGQRARQANRLRRTTRNLLIRPQLGPVHPYRGAGQKLRTAPYPHQLRRLHSPPLLLIS